MNRKVGSSSEGSPSPAGLAGVGVNMESAPGAASAVLIGGAAEAIQGGSPTGGVGLGEGVTKAVAKVSTDRVHSILTTCFCCALIVSNVLAAKALDFGVLALPASILTYPVVYIINDVLSDTFGFKRMRSTIMLGFGAAAIATLAFQIAIVLPGLDPSMNGAFATALGNSWRILVGSFAAYLMGSLLNSYLMSSLKKRFDKYLFFRCVFSTFAGEAVDSLIFISIAFWGQYSALIVVTMILSQVSLKVLYEIIVYPVTKWVIMGVRRHLHASQS